MLCKTQGMETKGLKTVQDTAEKDWLMSVPRDVRERRYRLANSVDASIPKRIEKAASRVISNIAQTIWIYLLDAPDADKGIGLFSANM